MFLCSLNDLLCWSLKEVASRESKCSAGAEDSHTNRITLQAEDSAYFSSFFTTQHSEYNQLTSCVEHIDVLN